MLHEALGRTSFDLKSGESSEAKTGAGGDDGAAGAPVRKTNVPGEGLKTNKEPKM